MKSTILLQIGVGIFLSAVPHCGKDKEYPVFNNIEVLDDVNISVTPKQLEYTIGDTIWLSVEISEEDLLSNSGFEGLTNGNGFFTFQIFKLEKAFVYFDKGAADFDLINSNGMVQKYDPSKYGSSSFRGVVRETYFEYQNKMYSFNIGLIAKVEGDFSFYIRSTTMFYDDMPDGSYDFRFINQHFLVNDNNKELFEILGYSDKIYIGSSTNNYVLPITDSTAFFAFSVK